MNFELNDSPSREVKPICLFFKFSPAFFYDLCEYFYNLKNFNQFRLCNFPRSFFLGNCGFQLIVSPRSESPPSTQPERSTFWVGWPAPMPGVRAMTVWSAGVARSKITQRQSSWIVSPHGSWLLITLSPSKPSWYNFLRTSQSTKGNLFSVQAIFFESSPRKLAPRNWPLIPHRPCWLEQIFLGEGRR